MIRIRSRVAIVAATALLGLSSFAFAVNMGGSKDRDDESAEAKSVDEADTLFRAGSDLAEAGRFQDALEKFEAANHKRRGDPKILNMLAYCQRKTGNLDAAFVNYRKALELRPDFPEAREYLGEAHLQAALGQLDILLGYGKKGEAEYALLADALQAAAAGLDDMIQKPAGAKKTGARW